MLPKRKSKKPVPDTHAHRARRIVCRVCNAKVPSIYITSRGACQDCACQPPKAITITPRASRPCVVQIDVPLTGRPIGGWRPWRRNFRPTRFPDLFLRITARIWAKTSAPKPAAPEPTPEAREFDIEMALESMRFARVNADQLRALALLLFADRQTIDAEPVGRRALERRAARARKGIMRAGLKAPGYVRHGRHRRAAYDAESLRNLPVVQDAFEHLN